jgi:toxin ParE1/3/4
MSTMNISLPEAMKRWVERQAEAYLDQLANTFEFLADNPEAARSREEIDPPIRIHPVQSHLVVYRVDDDGDVFVIRVRHGQEDWVAVDG